MATLNTNAEAVECVLREVDRLARLGLRQALAEYSFPENMCNLPHPSGRGMLFCGPVAYARLREVAEKGVAASPHAGRLDLQAVFKALRFAVVERFLKRQNPVSDREADRAVSSAIKHAAKSLTTLTHFIPCHLGDADEATNFCIGPVKFARRVDVLDRIRPALDDYLANPISVGNKPTQSDIESTKTILVNALEYYETFGWIAEVTVEKCDPPTSKRRATAIVRSALDCLHLLFGATHSGHMRIGGPRFGVDRRGFIQLDANGHPLLSWSVDWLSGSVPEGWWKALSEGGYMVDLLGTAVEVGHDLPVPPPLSQRVLDALSWYGEAMRDDFVAAKIVKYVTCMERILTTKEEKEVVRVFSERGASLAVAQDKGDFLDSERKFKGIYKWRSRLVHGTCPPSQVGLGKAAREAESLAQKIMFSALQFFGEDGLRWKGYSDRELDISYERYVDFARRKAREAPT